MPAICEDLKHYASIAASLARISGVNQLIVLPVIDNAVLKAVLELPRALLNFVKRSLP